MYVGLFLRSMRESRGPTIAFALGLFAFELLLGIILPTFQKEFSDKLMQVEFLQKIIAALLGTEVGMFDPRTALAMIGWVHPFVLALVWAHAIVLCTRFPSGALESGTLDVWLSLPVSRKAMQCGEFAAFAVCSAVLSISGLLGNLTGSLISGLSIKTSGGNLLLVTCNLYALSLAVGGAASCLSCLFDRRGRAMGAAFALLLACFFQSSMSSFNEIVKQFSPVSLMTYYRPYHVLHGTSKPWGDILVLMIAGGICGLIGLAILSRRDLSTS